MRRGVLLAAVLLALSVPVLADTLAGVTLPDTITVANKTLVLNGMGLRTKFFVKVYAGGAVPGEEVGRRQRHRPGRRGEANGAAVHPVRGDARADDRGVRRSVEEQRARQGGGAAGGDRAVPEGARDDAREGAAGRDLRARHGHDGDHAREGQADDPGAAFGQLVFSMWLGPKPPNADLKNGLLGKK